MPKRPAEYDVIIGQLLLTDFTVAKVMLSAILLGMAGVFIMRRAGLVRLHTKPGSIGSTVLSGIVLGVGFAILGYCPGTAATAFGSGAMDALMGMIGIVIGAGIFARLYPFLYRRILHWGAFPADTIAELVGLRPELWLSIGGHTDHGAASHDSSSGSMIRLDWSEIYTYKNITINHSDFP